jgi:hypothetical protein
MMRSKLAFVVSAAVIAGTASMASAWVETFEGMTGGFTGTPVGQNGWVAVDMDDSAQSTPSADLKPGLGIGGSQAAGSWNIEDWSIAGKNVGVAGANTLLEVSSLVYFDHTSQSAALRIGTDAGTTSMYTPAAGSGGGVYTWLSQAAVDPYAGATWGTRVHPITPVDLVGGTGWYGIKMIIDWTADTTTWQFSDVDDITGLGTYSTYATLAGTTVSQSDNIYVGFYTYGTSGAAAVSVDNVSAELSVIPEPATLGLMGLGALAMLRRKH